MPSRSSHLQKGPRRGVELLYNANTTRSELRPNLSLVAAVRDYVQHYVQLNLDGSDSHTSVGDRGGGRLGRVQGGASGTPDIPCHCSDCSDAVPAAGSEEGALGSLTGYCPESRNSAAACEPLSADDVQNSASNRPLDALMSSFELRARLRGVAADARIAKCGSVVYTDPTVVTEEFEDGTRVAHWTGVALCNRAGCPVCGAAKARKFREQCLRTLESGGYWHHVIFTVPHHAGESWDTVYERVLRGVRCLSKGQAGRIVMREVSATIRATETTWSVRSGWHVHLHVMWRLARPLLQGERWVVRRQWAESTGASLRHGCTFGLHFNAHDEQRRRQCAGYLTKIANEMSGAHKSAHPEHWTLGELYHRATEDADYVELVQQYQLHTKGKRLYQLDRRAKALHDAAPEPAELKVTHTWVTVVDRLEFRALSRRERFAGDPLACYLPLEVAARARGDPRSSVEDTIYGLISGR